MSKGSKGMKEVRGGKLIATIKAKLPNVGYVELSTNPRKAILTWRGLDFIVSSRLMVKELSFGRNVLTNTIDSEDSAILQNRLHA